MDMSSHLMGNQFDPDSGLFLYSNAGVAKLANALALGASGVPVIRSTPLASSTLVARTTLPQGYPNLVLDARIFSR